MSFTCGIHFRELKTRAVNRYRDEPIARQTPVLRSTFGVQEGIYGRSVKLTPMQSFAEKMKFFQQIEFVIGVGTD